MRGKPVLYQELSDLMFALGQYAASYSSLHVLCDENTYEKCWPMLAYASEWFASKPAVCVPAGESSKSAEILSGVWESLIENGADRKSLLLNLGGGVVCDLGGFAASTYMRGIDFIHIPTSLLAMADAAIGGKTGIDVGSYKNMAGTFCEAREVMIYPEFLDTLPEMELRSGFAEMLKHALLQGRDQWNSLKNLLLLPETIASYVQASSVFKYEVCSGDFREAGDRKRLNLGHTYGHALESHFLALGRPIPHGFAVAWGLAAEAKKASERGEISREFAEDVSNTVKRLYGEAPTVSEEELARYWKADKKNEGGEVTWVRWG